MIVVIFFLEEILKNITYLKKILNKNHPNFEKIEKILMNEKTLKKCWKSFKNFGAIKIFNKKL